MILGRGDLAQALKPYDRTDRIYFASGVSNSKCTDQDEFDREIELLFDQDRTKHIVYFGTLAMFYSDTPYTRHKKIMESLIKLKFKHWTIIRLGNITWGTNPNTLINNLKSKIKNGESFDILDSYRYLCTREDFEHWVDLIPSFNCAISITGERVKIEEIVRRINAGEL